MRHYQHTLFSDKFDIKCGFRKPESHFIDVIMTTMASQITSLTVVYSTIYSDADQRKHQSSASLAFVWGIHRWIPRTKGQLRGKCLHLMTSSCDLQLPFEFGTESNEMAYIWNIRGVYTPQKTKHQDYTVYWDLVNPICISEAVRHCFRQ